MRKILLTAMFVLGLSLAISGVAFAETRYLASLPDIPLMPQMQRVTDSDVLFDKAQGRIIEESVEAPHLTREDVVKFYAATLPELGWVPVSSTQNTSRFLRNGEQLIVNLEKLGSEAVVAFAVSPVQH